MAAVVVGLSGRRINLSGWPRPYMLLFLIIVSLVTATPIGASLTIGTSISAAVASANLFEKKTQKSNIQTIQPAAILETRRGVLIVGTPALFDSSGCSSKSIASYVKDAHKIKRFVDDVVVVATEDAHSMEAWGRQNNAANKVRVLADPDGSFVKAVGLTVNLPELGGLRAKRFAMRVEKGVVKDLVVEDDSHNCDKTLAPHVLKNVFKLREDKDEL